MKEATISTSRKIHKKSKQGASCDHQYKQVILHIYDTCAASVNEDTSDVIAIEYKVLLTNALRTASYRIGLERTFIREIASDKKCRWQEVTQRVLLSQTYGLGSDRQDLMRMASMSISRTSQLFAHQMAVALAASLL